MTTRSGGSYRAGVSEPAVSPGPANSNQMVNEVGGAAGAHPAEEEEIGWALFPEVRVRRWAAKGLGIESCGKVVMPPREFRRGRGRALFGEWDDSSCFLPVLELYCTVLGCHSRVLMPAGWRERAGGRRMPLEAEPASRAGCAAVAGRVRRLTGRTGSPVRDGPRLGCRSQRPGQPACPFVGVVGRREQWRARHKFRDRPLRVPRARKLPWPGPRARAHAAQGRAPS